MEYIKGTTTFKIAESTVLSLGKFDGIHRGHELLMDYVSKKKREGLKAVIFTFDIPPRKSLKRIQSRVLTTNQEKVRLFEEIGIDYLIECPFTPEIMSMEPEAFIEMIVKQLNVKSLVVGKDFHFGHKRRGDYRMLEKYADYYGYEVEVVDKMQEDGRDISSTFIREKILEGDIEKANQLLGYQYFVDGMVLHGRKMGRAVLGIPTINLIPEEEKLLPPFGVYLSITKWNGKFYPGITNIGCKPTIDGVNPIGIETHIFDFDKDIYGEEVKISFICKVREEKKFESLDLLKKQMSEDIECGREHFQHWVTGVRRVPDYNMNIACSVQEESLEEDKT